MKNYFILVNAIQREDLEGCTMFAWKSGSQAIVLYWAITFCSWEDGVFDCQEITSRVKT